LRQVEPGVDKYVASRNIAADHTRHGASGTRKRYRPSGEVEGAHTTHKAASDSMKDATTLSSPAGNVSSEHNPDGTLRTKGCVIGHRAFVPRMGSRTQNIELRPGPAQSYNTKSAIHASVRYGAGRGGFSLARPRPYRGPGGYVSGNPHPAPVRGPPART